MLAGSSLPRCTRGSPPFKNSVAMDCISKNSFASCLFGAPAAFVQGSNIVSVGYLPRSIRKCRHNRCHSPPGVLLVLETLKVSPCPKQIPGASPRISHALLPPRSTLSSLRSKNNSQSSEFLKVNPIQQDVRRKEILSMFSLMCIIGSSLTLLG